MRKLALTLALALCLPAVTSAAPRSAIERPDFLGLALRAAAVGAALSGFPLPLVFVGSGSELEDGPVMDPNGTPVQRSAIKPSGLNGAEINGDESPMELDR